MNIIEEQVMETAARIVADNEAFERAGPAKKRMMIAADIIARLKATQFVATSGEWTRLDRSKELANEESVQTLLNEQGIKCECCGVGAVMLSCVAFKNNVTVSDASGRGLDWGFIATDSVEDKSGVMEVFSKRQLAMIETAFEQGEGYYGPDNDNVAGLHDLEGNRIKRDEADISLADYRAAKKFANRQPDPEKRLVKIMKNIIAHRGSFVP